MKATDTFIWTVMGTLLYAAAAAVTKYTNRPLNGFYCNESFYENVSDVSQHQCIHRCLSNSQCATLSYNPVGLYCLLSLETCLMATPHPEFMLMVFREMEHHRDCISWIPGNDENTTKRLLTTTERLPFRLGRSNEGSNQIPGLALPPLPDVQLGMMFVADRNSKTGRWVFEYDVLAVSPSCTLAWVDYKATDALPDGAQQTGVVNRVAAYSIKVIREEFDLQTLGFYVAGDVAGYYWLFDDVAHATDMLILVRV